MTKTGNLSVQIQKLLSRYDINDRDFFKLLALVDSEISRREDERLEREDVNARVWVSKKSVIEALGKMENEDEFSSFASKSVEPHFRDKWAKKASEPKSEQQKAYLHYLARLLCGESVPGWMIGENLPK